MIDSTYQGTIDQCSPGVVWADTLGVLIVKVTLITSDPIAKVMIDSTDQEPIEQCLPGVVRADTLGVEGGAGTDGSVWDLAGLHAQGAAAVGWNRNKMSHNFKLHQDRPLSRPTHVHTRCLTRVIG